MIEFIIDNKEWLFSGVGVAVVLFFLNRPSQSIKGNNNTVAGRDVTNDKD